MPYCYKTSDKTLSTGKVAKILNLAPRTVNLMMDRGELEGFRMPSSGNHRRIYKDGLIRFMKRRGISLSLLDGGTQRPRVLLAGCDDRSARAVRGELADGADCQLAHSVFACGRLVETFAPDVLVLDWVLGRSACLLIASELAAERPGVRVVGLAAEDESQAAALVSTGGGFAKVFVRPFDVALLVEAVGGLLGD